MSLNPQILQLNVLFDLEGAEEYTKATSKDSDSESTNEMDEMQEELMDPVVEARDFLVKHPLAKILIVIDMHCLENGAFVWKDNTPMSYQGCLLLEVSLHLL